MGFPLECFGFFFSHRHHRNIITSSSLPIRSHPSLQNQIDLPARKQNPKSAKWQSISSKAVLSRRISFRAAPSRRTSSRAAPSRRTSSKAASCSASFRINLPSQHRISSPLLIFASSLLQQRSDICQPSFLPHQSLSLSRRHASSSSIRQCLRNVRYGFLLGARASDSIDTAGLTRVIRERDERYRLGE
jgi:hypothetical protein